MTLEDYILEHISPEHPYLYRLYRATNIHLLRPRMASGMERDGHIYTFEINDEQEDFTRPWIENSPWADQISMIIGNVSELLPTMQLPPLDLVFIDANKRDDIAYYRLLRPMMRPGGWMMADNTLWDGHVTDPAYDRDAQTIAIRDFNRMLAEEAARGDIDVNILDLRDGLTLIHIQG